jgi:hypothetical protein
VSFKVRTQLCVFVGVVGCAAESERQSKSTGYVRSSDIIGGDPTLPSVLLLLGSPESQTPPHNKYAKEVAAESRRTIPQHIPRLLSLAM